MFDTLASPGNIGRLRLKNRFILSPLQTMLADRHGQVTPEMLAYYRERAVGGAALVITEYSHIDAGASRASIVQLGAYDDDCTPGLARLADVLQHAGALAGLQIAHAGRQRFLAAPPILAPSRIPWEALHAGGAPVPQEVSVEEIQTIVEAFGRAAARAQLAGFDLVEVHGGHGYLVHEFLSPHTNRRTDLYGGSLASRQRFLREVIRSIKRTVGPDYPITVRLSGSEHLPDGVTPEESVETAAMLEEEGVAAIDISAGIHHTMDAQIQPMYYPHGFNVPVARMVKERVRIPVSVVGSINSPELAEEIIREGAADFVRLGRALVADPHLPRKALSGRAVDIRPCIRCNACLDRGIGQSHAIRCSVNFTAGREERYRPEDVPRSEHPRRVAIIGGGPAGLEAARVAADAGHDVTLYERGRLGGALNEAALSPLKGDLKPYLDYLVEQVAGRVRLVEGPASRDLVQELSPDVLVLAAGAKPVDAGILGVPPDRVVDLRAALGGAQVGNQVVVCGEGQFAAEVALYLAEQGRSVTLLWPGFRLAQGNGGGAPSTVYHAGSAGAMEIAMDAGEHTRTPLLRYLAESTVRIEQGWVREVDDKTCLVESPMGSCTELPCDTIVSSAYEPNVELLDDVSSGPWRLERIGDCLAPRRVFDAVHEASLLARTL
jgi:2,4-dienoyl-CoA reductase-like NADH-dependent reductase (Old Yellow Enzyme family)